MVKVVTNTLSLFLILLSISIIKSSIWFLLRLISISGSTKPVGLLICSTTIEDFSNSYFAGVALKNNTVGILFSNSSKRKGLLSYADGNLKP